MAEHTDLDRKTLSEVIRTAAFLNDAAAAAY